jgi:CRISPR system Cascade subunit CasC
VVRDFGLCSLTNAFEQPIRPDHKGSLVENSMRALDTYWRRLTRMYGTDGLVGAWLSIMDDTLELPALGAYRVDSVRAVIDGVLATVAQPVAV